MPIYNEMTKEEYEKEQKRLKREKWEIELEHQLLNMDYFVTFAREYKWHPVRRWRTDFLISDQFEDQSSMDWAIEHAPGRMKEVAILVEIEGGTYTRGRHTRGSGFIKDCIKYNTAAAMGWRVFRFTAEMVKSGDAIKFLKEEVWKTE